CAISSRRKSAAQRQEDAAAARAAGSGRCPREGFASNFHFLSEILFRMNRTLGETHFGFLVKNAIRLSALRQMLKCARLQSRDGCDADSPFQFLASQE